MSALAGVSVAARAQEAEPASATEQAMSLPPCAASDGSLGVRWIVNAGSLRRAETAIPLDEQQRLFGTPCTFLIGKQKLEPYAQWNAVGTMTIRSADEAAQCCTEGVGAVLYDPEAWRFTPAEERAHPGAAACRVAERVHALHRLLIVAPAADLVGGGRERFSRFLKAKIAERSARCADVYEIQAQGTEPDVGAFRDFVRAATAQARAAHRGITVLAGISTNPTGREVSVDAVDACVRAVRDEVSGFWLNIPAGGAACPSCGEPKPEVAAELLKKMAAEGH
ncbi:MAG TPA: hypothetical protein VGR64_10060 [Terracidiphilus sp.]|nr:hypothetical protein [Terracidiphilus sp.]